MLKQYKTRFYEWLAYKLPNELVHFCALRLIAYGTCGQYSYTNPTTVRAITVLRRWGADGK